MADHAVSDHPAVQAALDRLATLSPGRDILGLRRITTILARLGDPHLALPPVFHVAGTNGKGSTCAFLRAALEADGRKVHVYSSPHLCRFNERIRVAGTLIGDDELAARLTRVMNVAEDVSASFFEVTTAAAFLGFAERAADACIIEVGLGGRLDATNVIAAPAIGGIAQLGVDHQAFLGDRLTDIAAEKAGIAKAGTTMVTMRYLPEIASVVGRRIDEAGAYWLPRGESWDIAAYRGRLHYRDAAGRLDLPLPRLPGAHQFANLGLATAMLRHQRALEVSEAALRAAPLWAQWPARLQGLDAGPVKDILPADWRVTLDGGHNPDAGLAIAAWLAETLGADERVDLVIGMLANKDVEGFLAPICPHVRSIRSLPVPGHDHHGPEAFAAIAEEWRVPHSAHSDVIDAVLDLAATRSGEPTGAALICGSLYLAGQVLKLNGQEPG
ncbi:bifunctional folylpolyglutamate synthase/dihydrofolate synthase [Sphingobium sp. CR28]|uniref:bifunctional folylpolyglutamate synthase/dihydrofolate synthase n=1 Tax=Sphingobium sp. CR28 TaxID=3400272 RepID=UPI003FEF2812